MIVIGSWNIRMVIARENSFPEPFGVADQVFDHRFVMLFGISLFDPLQPMVEMKPYRGIREIERKIENDSSAEAEVAKDYVAAIRSLLLEDGNPPLDLPGIRIYENAQAIQASLQRCLDKKGDSSYVIISFQKLIKFELQHCISFFVVEQFHVKNFFIFIISEQKEIVVIVVQHSTTHRLARYPGIAAFSSFSSPRERK